MKTIKQDVKNVLKGVAIGTLCVVAFNIGKCKAQNETDTLVTFNKSEIREIVNTMEDIVEWQESDIEEGETRFFHLQINWLTEMIGDLNTKLHE